MKTILSYSAELLILSFLVITFFWSFYDKVSDWKGQVFFLKDYFSKTFVPPFIPAILVFIVILEAFATIFCSLGIYQIIANQETFYALVGCIVCCVILLIFLFGQRIAKDFDGARNMAIYFILAVFGVYLLQ
ncbi:DoxX family protein [Tamlana sp. 2_MG-2023]|uniref:DoxX family protein n=1 Tax=unclassified Tamlana TaxID=2614803 RepID=UPI0026E476D9|nr:MULTISPECIES: DoxX family protein [unclassified Tamlana]MDO6759652.1 DoxX family protein [Tamlana sp. 2_MG-2023]MDO6791275.1 DoxX family protein [Tamlana sp. 1_MG-2023]